MPIPIKEHIFNDDAKNFDSPNKTLFEKIQEMISKEFISYEADNKGRTDSIIFIGVAFDPIEKKTVACSSAIVGTSSVLEEALVKVAGESDFSRVVLHAGSVLMENSLSNLLKEAHAETESNNDERVG